MKRSILILSFLMVSCVGQKKVSTQKQTEKQTNKVLVRKDSVKIIDRSLAINDKISLSLKTNDKKIDSIIRLRLKNFYTSKTSGNNRYTAKFDYEKLALEIAAVLNETVSKNVEKNTEKKTDKNTKVTTEEYLYRKLKVVPWWFWVVLAVVFLPQILSRLELIINPLKAFFKK